MNLEGNSGFELFKGERAVALATRRSGRMGRHSVLQQRGLKGCSGSAGEAGSLA